jgi:hypothetical protein
VAEESVSPGQPVELVVAGAIKLIGMVTGIATNDIVGVHFTSISAVKGDQPTKVAGYLALNVEAEHFHKRTTDRKGWLLEANFVKQQK